MNFLSAALHSNDLLANDPTPIASIAKCEVQGEIRPHPLTPSPQREGEFICSEWKNKMTSSICQDLIFDYTLSEPRAKDERTMTIESL